MTQETKPYLFLKRLVIISHLGAVAYDEVFHKGVNIIRGKNSSGKSTIANFIFYALGGEYNNWNTESIKCKEVYSEVEINGAVYTLRRSVSALLRQPMSIFWGSFDEAKSDAINWKTFSYSQAEDRLSFSNILFNALSFPAVKSENEGTITVNQILRLLYIDQDSPTQNLFKYEYFDHPLTRQAVSELLLGVYDDSLYNERLTFRRSQKEFEEKKKEFDSLNRAYTKSGNATTVEELDKVLNKTKLELSSIQEEINKTKQVEKIRIATNSDTKSEQIQNNLIAAKQSLANTTDEIYQLDLDIVDSRHFIETLKKRVAEIENSILTRKNLGQLSLDHCPECLSPLDAHTTEGHCFLCKQILSETEERTYAKRLKQELELQVIESTTLLNEKEKRISEQRGQLQQRKEKLIQFQRELDLVIAESQSSRDEKLDSLLVQKGGIEKQIEILTKQLEGIHHLELLKTELAELARAISLLRISIEQRENSQENKKNSVLQDIKQKAIYLLRHDLDRQQEFKNAAKVEIDFYNDSMSLDGNFNFSASSNTYLKNAIRFSIFFSSMAVEFMRYPKFILCDNMEDKGMEKERTQNFQRIIAERSEKIKEMGEHQIIFTTSMIADELDGTFYCVGDFYDQNNRTLKL